MPCEWDEIEWSLVQPEALLSRKQIRSEDAQNALHGNDIQDVFVRLCLCGFVFTCKRPRSQCSSRQIPESRVLSTLKKDLNPRPRPFDITLDILGKHQISWSKGEKRISIYVREMSMIPACNVCMQCIWRQHSNRQYKMNVLGKDYECPFIVASKASHW